jgi:hypothetical protein
MCSSCSHELLTQTVKDIATAISHATEREKLTEAEGTIFHLANESKITSTINNPIHRQGTTHTRQQQHDDIAQNFWH